MLILTQGLFRCCCTLSSTAPPPGCPGGGGALPVPSRGGCYWRPVVLALYWQQCPLGMYNTSNASSIGGEKGSMVCCKGITQCSSNAAASCQAVTVKLAQCACSNSLCPAQLRLHHMRCCSRAIDCKCHCSGLWRCSRKTPVVSTRPADTVQHSRQPIPDAHLGRALTPADNACLCT